MEIESDEEVAAGAHALPADKKKEEVVRQHQHKHRKHEQVQVTEEAVVAAFVRHVAGGVNVNQKSDAGDDENHYARERIDLESPVCDKFANPAVEHVIRNGGNPLE